MRFLLDENLSERLGALLVAAGHDAAHVRAQGLIGADDAEVLAFALRERRVLVSSDTDFGTLLARTRAAEPSVILFRRDHGRRAADQAALILDHLDDVREALEQGAVVVIQDDRIRVRALPLLPD